MKLFTIYTCVISMIFFSCEQNQNNPSLIKNKDSRIKIQTAKVVSSMNNERKVEKKKQHIVFNIPSPSGPGTGVCQVTLTIENRILIATETCGGHDENGHTESINKLFKIEFIKNHLYKVSDLINTKYGSSFGCEFFEIKENKLFLYDINKKILNEWFCTEGKIENRIENMETCDCIFLPYED